MSKSKDASFVSGALAGCFALTLALGSTGVARAELLVGLTTGNQLVSFNSGDATTILSSSTITGVGVGESIVGIDYRPANDVLFGLGSTNRLYTIDASTGVATVVSGTPFAPDLTSTNVGFDFNPVVDRLRVVNDNNQNLRLNADTGVTASSDPNVAYVSGDTNFGVDPTLVGSGYENSFAPSPRTPPPGTTLYGIDSGLDILVEHSTIAGDPVGSFSGLNTVGSLGFNFDENLGFDISGVTGIAYIGGHNAGDAESRLFTVDLDTGVATAFGFVGGLNSGIVLRGLTVAPVVVPEPASLAMAGLGLLALVGLARRRKAVVA